MIEESKQDCGPRPQLPEPFEEIGDFGLSPIPPRANGELEQVVNYRRQSTHNDKSGLQRGLDGNALDVPRGSVDKVASKRGSYDQSVERSNHGSVSKSVTG